MEEDSHENQGVGLKPDGNTLLKFKASEVWGRGLLLFPFVLNGVREREK